MKLCFYIIFHLCENRPMERIISFAATIIFLNFSCSENSLDDTKLYWIDSKSVDCQSFIAKTCYRVQQGTAINNNNWLLFHDTIEGFYDIYEEGFYS